MAELKYLTQDQLEEFDEVGYLVFEGAIDPDLNQRIKDDVDLMMEDRARGEKKMVMSYDELGALTSEPVVVDRVADLMDGKKFTHHHIHARWQGEGERGVSWHHDYVQLPQTNRSHLMVHVFMYLDGLNGEIGDLLVMPGTHKKVMNGDAYRQFEFEDLPGSVTHDSLAPGSIIIVHSAVQHARRPKPGGQSFRRYFIDTSYCQEGVLWGSYTNVAEINKVAMEKGFDRDGKYAYLYDTSQFYDRLKSRELLAEKNVGSLALHL
jgi:ectoine hydroxylase-related dioxygenase (phytanoyl-CoA dioxygenase family)